MLKLKTIIKEHIKIMKNNKIEKKRCTTILYCFTQSYIWLPNYTSQAFTK